MVVKVREERGERLRQRDRSSQGSERVKMSEGCSDRLVGANTHDGAMQGRTVGEVQKVIVVVVSRSV